MCRQGLQDEVIGRRRQMLGVAGHLAGKTVQVIFVADNI